MKSIFTLLLIFTSSLLIGQFQLPEYGIKRYGNSIEQSFHTANNISQDSLGRILAFTTIGQNHYFTFDGVEFTYSSIFETDRNLLLEDSVGIWSVEDAFFLLLETRNDTFKIDTRKYLNRNITFIRYYDNNYYLFTNDGLLKLSYKAGKLTVNSSHKYGRERIYNAHLSDDTLFVKSKKIHGFVLLDNLDDWQEYEIEVPPSDKLMMLPGNRLIPEEFEPYKSELLGLNSSIVNPMVDSKGNLWMYLRGSDAGVYKFEHSDKLKKRIELGLEKGTYCSFYEDNLGDIWVGTYGEGLLHLYDKAIHILDKEYGFQSNNIWSISQKDGGRVLLSEGCSGIEDVYNGKITNISPGCFGAVYSDSKERIWATTVGVMLFENGRARKFTKDDGLYSRTVSCMFEDSDHEMWFGTRRVLHKYVDGKFKQYLIEDTDVYDRIFNIVELGKGKLLLALDNGTFYIFENERFKRLAFQEKMANQIFKDIEGNIWLATQRKGLYLYDNESFTKLPIPDMDIDIRFIQDGYDGMLWALCSENKIFYIEKETLLNEPEKAVLNYITSDDGLPLISSNTKLQPAAALLKSGNIVFPNIHGAIHINPKKYTQSKVKYNTEILINSSSLKREKSLEFQSKVKYVDLTVNTIYLNPEAKIINQYKLNDSEWIAIDRGITSRIDLPKFENTLLVRSKHINSEWEIIGSISLDVTRPYYLQWWFWFLVLLLTTFLIYSFIKLRIKNISQQNKKLEEKVQEQTAIIESEKEQLAKTLEKQQLLTHELNVAQTTKNRMYAQVSHEFKSPLQALQSFLNSSNPMIDSSEKERISRNVKSLLKTSEEIMELSRAESGNLKLKTNHYNINGIIKEQIELKYLQAAEKNIEITFATPDESVYLECDIQQIQKVIANLLSNAIKFSDYSSAITVESVTTNGYQEIQVQDHGKGIPSDEIMQLKEAYYQASNTDGRGTGIGLSLSEEILKLHNSTLNIESVLGEGSIFSFKLKLPEETQEEIMKKYSDSLSVKKQISEQFKNGKQTILIVDDNKDILFYLKTTLQNHYNIFTASQGAGGLYIANTQEVHLIISDVNMPLMSGFELLKAIRNNEKLESIPFLFLTGSQSEETELLSLKSGADLVISKPVREEYLIPQIRQLLKRQSQVMDLANKSIAHNLLPPELMDDDRALMKKVEEAILENLNNSKLKSEDIAREVGVGEKTLRNRVKRISGYTLKEYLKLYRLNKAKLLIEQNYGTKSEIAAATGFSSLSYFSKNYNAWLAEKEES